MKIQRSKGVTGYPVRRTPKTRHILARSRANFNMSLIEPVTEITARETYKSMQEKNWSDSEKQALEMILRGTYGTIANILSVAIRQSITGQSITSDDIANIVYASVIRATALGITKQVTQEHIQRALEKSTQSTQDIAQSIIMSVTDAVLTFKQDMRNNPELAAPVIYVVSILQSFPGIFLCTKTAENFAKSLEEKHSPNIITSHIPNIISAKTNIIFSTLLNDQNITGESLPQKYIARFVAISAWVHAMKTAKKHSE